MRNRRALEEALDVLAIPAEGATVEVFATMERVLRIVSEREAERHGVWRGSGLKGMVFHVFSKAERCFARVQREDLGGDDDLPDLIAYACFAEILRQEGNLNGEWPWEGNDDPEGGDDGK